MVCPETNLTSGYTRPEWARCAGLFVPESMPKTVALPCCPRTCTFTAAMMPLSLLRSAARQCIAAVAMFGFSLNVATPTIAHGCAHPAGAMAGAAHQGHHPDPAPAESSHGKKCQCVGHSCGTALAVPAPVATGPHVVPAVIVSVPLYRADRQPAVAQHLLPFAVGPPSSIPA